jgi:hypothetical protein
VADRIWFDNEDVRMTERFDYFVIFAEMRTGSNLLEATLGQIDGLTCHGEAFNPDYVGGPNTKDILGVSMKDRIKDPMGLLKRIRDADGFNGFRFFFDHEPRVLRAILDDPRCAKIILTRNPVECYVSLKIAFNTDRWQLKNVKDRIEWKSPFKPAEFAAFLEDRQQFQIQLLNALQVSGQTAFYLDYEDSLQVDLINGLVRFLGLPEGVKSISGSLVRQNPEGMAQKVRKFDDMQAELAKVDWANLSRTPNFEPRRGPGVPRFIAASGAPLLFMPIRPFRDDHLRDWLGGLGAGGLVESFNQKSLRDWKKSNPCHRSFTVIRHPVARAQTTFESVLISDEFADLRSILRRHYDVPFPRDAESSAISASDYRGLLLEFLRFVKLNLNDQTSVRQSLHWASQSAVLSGLAQLASPDLIAREDRLSADLAYLCQQVDIDAPAPAAPADDSLFPLAQIYDAAIETATRNAYQRDYLAFGYDAWQT